jgi:transposase
MNNPTGDPESSCRDLEDANSHEVQQTRRLAAIELRKNGVKPAVIAASFGVAVQTVYNWVSKAKRFGPDALKSTKATGAPSALTQPQIQDLKTCLRRPASELGYATDLWSGPRVRHFIKHRYGVEYHVNYMPRFLRGLGLVQKFPERRALEQDPEAVRRWKEERLPEILADAKQRRAYVFYADEALISLIPSVGKTWAFGDQKPIARVSGLRGQHIGVTGAVNPRGHLYFEMTPEGERFTAAGFLRFIQNLRKEFPRRPIVLIVDGAPIHRAKIVTEFVAAHAWLRLEILPSYSPELNPSEHPWRYVKSNGRNGSQSRNKTELRAETHQLLCRLKRKDKQKYVQSFFTP